MTDSQGPGRRTFLKSLSIAGAVSARAETSSATSPSAQSFTPASPKPAALSYPRTFTGPQLAMISFPLGGIGAGSIGLGGRGQLRDWEIFNKPDKGNSLQYSFPSIWVQPEGAPAIAHVLEARIEPPYEGQNGLGSRNAPGLSRLEGATFTGESPAAKIDFHDARLPVQIALEAGSPFVPLDADESGLPVAILRYRVRNTGRVAALVSIAYSIENPVKPVDPASPLKPEDDKRVNTLRTGSGLNGLYMQNAGLASTDLGFGTFSLAALTSSAADFSSLIGWPAGRWWNSPLLFWDDCSKDGKLGPAPEHPNSVGSICLGQEVAAGAEAEYVFLLTWHFPNRTPKRCGWDAPKGHENTVIGNWYTTRFPDAWAVAEYVAANLKSLTERTMRFVFAMRETTIYSAVKEAATANLSTLVSTTCFRTSDGEFHGFEGVNDKLGCCFGNCTHVWNYEIATSHLFPSFARSLHKAAFGFSMDERGAIYFRQLLLPDGIERFGYAAADGQMGQIIKIYLDWQLSGGRNFLNEFWPKAKRALEFAWTREVGKPIATEFSKACNTTLTTWNFTDPIPCAAFIIWLHFAHAKRWPRSRRR